MNTKMKRLAALVLLFAFALAISSCSRKSACPCNTNVEKNIQVYC